MSITVLSPGALTTVQDLGRWGHQRFGVPTSGAMDPRALRTANILVGNDEGEACLECTLLGPTLRFERGSVIALTGGDLGAMIDDTPLAPYRAVAVEAGQKLHFTTVRTGCRAYLAVQGGLDLPLTLGSRSTYLRAALGGFEGRALRAGDVLPIKASKITLNNLALRHIDEHFIPREEYTLRVLLGPQDDYFSSAGLETFLSALYTVAPASDRMGCRLSGPPIAHKTTGDIISDGIALGAIQVPADGEPIIMLADRQSVGGYTKIATVISPDLRILAQLKPGDRLRFTAVSIYEAQEALRAERAALNTLKAVLAQF